MRENEPHLWCLLGKKAGDNTQLLALAEAVGWGYEAKQIVARRWELLPHLVLGTTLLGIDRKASSGLAPPWPDLVLTAGRRNEPVARWIQQQSGGRTRLVHVGRPWAPLKCWDMVITTPQYFLPERPNVHHNRLPLNDLDAATLLSAAASLRDVTAHLRQPLLTLLVGGDSGKFVFTEEKARRLGRWTNDLAARAGGSLLITDSPRTPAAAMAALTAEVEVPALIHRWSSGADNPYRGFLGLGDAVIVTGESMSMLGEATVTGKPLFVFDMGDPPASAWRLGHSYRSKPLSHRLAMRLAPQRMRRDVGRIQSVLVGEGGAEWLTADAVLPSPGSAAPALRDVSRSELQASAEAVRRLVKPD